MAEAARVISGDEAKAIRERLGLSQQALADALDVTRRTVIRMEDRGAYRLQHLALMGLAYRMGGAHLVWSLFPPAE